MKKLLFQLDPDRVPSAFDRVVAYDAGSDEVLSYGGVAESDITGLVHGAIFTRGPKDLRNTAIFVGGSSLPASERILDAVKRAFFGPFRVSVLLDPNGSNTTAAAAVLKLVRASGGEVRGRRAAIFAGTGPVGSRAAGLLVKQGAEVTITSRDAGNAAEAARRIGEGFHGSVSHAVVRGPDAAEAVLDGTALVLAAGPSGVQLLPRGLWSRKKDLLAIADVNAVPPSGVEGVEATDDGALRDGVHTFGALGIGGLKMKLHKAAIARLFERNDLVLDAEDIYDIASAL